MKKFFVIKILKKKRFRAVINSNGIRGEVTAIQETPFDPTWINISLTTTNDLKTRLLYATKVASYRIHELPPEPAKSVGFTVDDSCLTTKKMFNPSNIDEEIVPPAGNNNYIIRREK